LYVKKTPDPAFARGYGGQAPNSESLREQALNAQDRNALL
jgi:hypothetical protein